MAVVKTEINVDPSEEVFRIIEDQQDGIDNDTLNHLTPSLSILERQHAINALLADQRLEILKQGEQIKFRVKKGTQLAGVSQEEQLIYQLVEESATNGIWIRELREGSGLSQIQLRKVLKQLETRKLIKTVKAVGTTRKCYMLSQLEPSTTLTGGTFYSDQQLDTELIQTMVTLCVGFLQARRRKAIEEAKNSIEMQKELSLVRPSEISAYIVEKRVLKMAVSDEDIDRVLEVAILDGSVERRPDGRLRAIADGIRTSALVTIPCATCPVIDDCKPGHVISPATCQYMKDWIG
ncbi:unnamed protein product, partial [Mesorhabditis belari]|uniref:DNA-directed RNA polymerase III subunit RPC6 n=1 Tax=Mesorhabditis belari TaxID=2138241 RepID=A0AAF3F7U8_9BILA